LGSEGELPSWGYPPLRTYDAQTSPKVDYFWRGIHKVRRIDLLRSARLREY
jgi:hypothetical protein